MTPAERPDTVESFDNIESLSKWLKCSRGTVYNLMADGMPYLTLTRGGDRRFDRDAVLRWLEDRKVGAPVSPGPRRTNGVEVDARFPERGLEARGPRTRPAEAADEGEPESRAGGTARGPAT